MTNCYSGAFDLDFQGEPGGRPCEPTGAADAPSGAPPAQLCTATAQPAVEEAQPAAQEEARTEAGPLGPAAAQHALLYVRSARLERLREQLPVNRERSLLVHSLVEAAGLLELADVEEARPASIEELREYHSLQYLTALAHVQKLKEAQRAAAGLQDDCAPFPGLFEYAALLAGGSLQAAAGLASGRWGTAVHFDGGRHHAHKSRAAGFCYVNDVVLAVLRLLGSFRRVLYVDVDVHHCDAVQEAYNLTDRVLTVSLHKHAPGFYPGTGSMGSVGEGAGRGYSLNLPLGDGLRDDRFAQAFSLLAGGAVQLYQPDCVVLQCGVDGMAHDPVAGGCWGLTPRGYAAVAAEAAGWGLPLLVLGGGGYADADAARAWAAVLAALLGKELPADLPTDYEHLDQFGPNFQFTPAKPPLARDSNSAEGVAASCQRLLGLLRQAVEARRPGGGTGAGVAGQGVAQPGPSVGKRARVT